MSSFAWNVTGATLGAMLLPFLFSLLKAVVVFAIGWALIKSAISFVQNLLRRSKIDVTLHAFILSIVRISLIVLLALTCLQILGFEITTLLTALGAVGLAISLAVKDSLSNLAGGIMGLISKPFAVGDFVEAGGLSGTVSDIGLVYTKLTTIDNKIIYVPNGEISGEKIVNYNGQTQRRVDLKFDISYDSDPEKAKQVIQEVVGAHPKALFTPAPFARVSSYNQSSVSVTVRVWCATEDYWDLYFDLLEQIRVSFDRNGIELTYNHLNVHIVDTGR